MFYEQVKGLCAGRHIAITSLARQLNLSPSAPNNWKEGTLPKAETIMKISEFFDVSTDFLLYGRDRVSETAAHAADGATVLQHSAGNTVTVTNSGGGSKPLDGFASELLRIYDALDMRGKSALLQAAYAIEEEDRKH